jgi:glycine/D-amino acid oxidase-like deaminating enzyme
MANAPILPDRRRVVIVGGGAIGSSIAYHLAAHPRFAGGVTVVERDPTYARAASALSASSIRQQFSTPLNIALSQAGLAFLGEAGRLLAVDGEGPALGLRTPGYLFLATAAGRDALIENHAVQRAAGAEVALLDPAALAARFSWLSTGGVVAGVLGLKGEGWFDGPALLAAFRRRARSLGVTYVARDAVGFERAGAAVRGVCLSDGGVLPCDVAVNAAGPWSARVAGWLGIDLPVRARRRMVFVLACRDTLPGCPLVVDPTGVWFRPEGAGFICGRSPDEGEPDPDEPPLEVDEAEFTERMWPVLADRVPAFEAVKITGSWAGYYELNLFDGNAVVGPHPDFPNFLFATGFSGHGIQHAPGIGRGVAELIATGGYTTLDLSPLDFRRIPEGRRLVERNIV